MVVSAGLSQPSSTRLLADRLGAATIGALHEPATVETVELRDLAHDITNAMLTGFAAPALQAGLDDLGAADARDRRDADVQRVATADCSSRSSTSSARTRSPTCRCWSRRPAAPSGTRSCSTTRCGRCSPTCTRASSRSGCTRPRATGAPVTPHWASGSIAPRASWRQLSTASSKRPANDGFDNVVSFETLLAG